MRDSEIFAGFSTDEYGAAMSHISAGTRSYRRGQVIFTAGDITDRLGVVIAGSVSIEASDMAGNVTLLGIVDTGGNFAGTYALLGEPMMVDVRANTDCSVHFLCVRGVDCPGTWGVKLIRNLLTMTARKNLHLSERSFINAAKTIRRRVMSYLNAVSLRESSRDFTIPMSRQQLADYLSTDRSALSKELCLMRDEGLITFRKNHFTLHV